MAIPRLPPPLRHQQAVVGGAGGEAYACDRREFLLLARSEEEAPALHYRFLNRRLDFAAAPVLGRLAVGAGAGQELQPDLANHRQCWPGTTSWGVGVLIGQQYVREYASGSEVDIAVADLDVVLTYVLQLLTERGHGRRLAFKGGTALRKVVFGSVGRFCYQVRCTGSHRASDGVVPAKIGLRNAAACSCPTDMSGSRPTSAAILRYATRH